MVLLPGPVSRSVVPVVTLECGMHGMGRASGRMHIRRVKDHAIDFSVLVGEISAINPVNDVGLFQPVQIFRDLFPEDALAVCDICHGTAWSHVQAKDTGKYVVVAVCISAEYKVVRWLSVRHTAASFLPYS